MTRSIGPVLADILEAIDGIEVATRRKSRGQFEADWVLRHAVQRAIEIISEACRHLPDEVLAPHPEIPWGKVRAAGNVLRHEYFRVADDVIWSVVVDELPPLRRAVVGIRAAVDPGYGS